MIDPISLVSLIGLCGSICCRVAQIITGLDALRESYKHARFAIEGLNAQINAVEAAASRLASWLRQSSQSLSETEYIGLGKSMSACANLISALEESRVAYHAVMQQPLVAGARCVTEIIFVIKVHIDRTNFHGGARNLCPEAHQDSFVRLNVEDEAISGQPLNGSISKHDERRALEANCDFRIADTQPFSGAQIERNIRPTPVIDQQFERDESLSG